MPASRRFTAFVTSFVVSISAGVLMPTAVSSAAEGDEELPRYRLPVGRVLTYTSQGTSKREDGRQDPGSKGSSRVTVVGENPDGSRRIIVQSSSSYGPGEPDVNIGGFDVSPDGHSKPLGGFNPRVGIKMIFPLLPADAAQARTKWKSPPDWDSSVAIFTPAAPSEGGVFTFTSVEEGPINAIYVSTRNATIHFDRAKGVVTKVVAEYTQGWGIKSTGSSTMTLEKDETIDPDKAAGLGKEYQLLFDAQARQLELMKQVGDAPEKAETLLSEAKTALADAAKKVSEPEVVREFESALKQQERSGRYILDEVKRRAGVLNKPAAAWEADDLDGTRWSQEKLRGKVVVMDFWYRGCGWCMYAMPQVKQLAADYKDKPVVVLGMNTDRDLEDARFVVKTLGLAYPQIQATGLPEKFGVQGFPTLVIIDQEGVVRRLHVGYSPDLREKVGKHIDELLAKNPA